MATRPSRSTAAQAATPAVKPETAAIPAAWGDEPIEEFAGHNLTDKADLVGTPFLIIGVEIERTEGKDYDVAYVYALDTNGTEFEFSDAGSGVRAQIQALLADKGLPPHAGAGFQKLRTVIRQGLRFNDYTIEDPETGKKRKATTWYLSAAGRQVPSETA